jgi:hypothetical protein
MGKIIGLVGALVLTGGCSFLTPELVAALSKDNASFCASSDVRGGVGSVLAPAGGYGQGTFAFCRSNFPNASVSLKPDGSIAIQHGDKIE